MKIISIIGQKGGTGKTTLACALSVSATLDGLTTVALDLDPQVSLSEWGDLRSADTPVVTDCQPPRLDRALAAAKSGGADLCIIDTAGRAEVAALAAAKAADLLIIPCQPTLPDLQKVSAARDIARLAGNTNILVVLTRVKSQPRQAEAVNCLTTEGITVSPYFLAERVAYQDAYALGQSPQEREPNSKAATECIQIYKYTNIQMRNMI